MKMINLENVKKETKTIKNGIRFRPSVYSMLHEISKDSKESMAGKIESMIVDEYKKIKGVV